MGNKPEKQVEDRSNPFPMGVDEEKAEKKPSLSIFNCMALSQRCCSYEVGAEEGEFDQANV